MIGRFFVASAAWGLACSAALSPAHAQSAGEAQGLPEGYIANEYQTFTAAIALDDKCSALSYQYRSLVDDMVLGSMLDLPGVAGTSSADMGMQAYYDNIEKVAAPLGEAARARAAAIPCSQADQFLGEVQLSVIADLFALIQLSDGKFETMATDGEKGLVTGILNEVRRALQGAPQGTFEGFVQARMLRRDVSGEEAADYALGNLRKVQIARAINGLRKDLRRDGEREGWILWDPMTRSAVPDMVFSDPAIIPVRKAQGTGLGKRYRLDDRAVILPFKGRGLEFALLSFFPGSELGPVTGVISAGSGNISAFGTVDYTNAHARATDTDCVQGAQCLRFDSQTTRSIKRRVEGGMNRFGLHMVLVRPEGSDVEESALKIRSMTSPALDATYNPSVEDLFPDAFKAARAAD